MKDKVKEVLENLKHEREEYRERIISLHYAYDSAIEQLEKILEEQSTGEWCIHNSTSIFYNIVDS